ncbi:MAG: hypothetical protein A2091_01035 [Desulfuromonadales bacterium GWD2_61_12]|nr:MAG: hypothetical protein A2091_01035 [Desulfuromonadales bacterium GWD2_61_12]HAD03363.1 hypothetical protein [Desulfuromonas sp.]HBT83819.1 hypothetical protein [Desulfuromonas sp.]
MKINNIYLQNFRCFKELKLSFDGKTTVIVGVNGAGKTAILDSIALLFGRILTKLPNVKGISLTNDDLRITSKNKLSSHLICYISATNRTDVTEWSINKNRDTSAKTKVEILKHVNRDYVKGVKDLDSFINSIISAENDGTEYTMPLLVYYGTDRAVFDTPMRRRNFKTQFKRFDSLTGALSPSAKFKQAFEWFHAKENEEAREQKKRLSFDYADAELGTVRRAIQKVLPEFTNPRTELRPLRFLVDKKIANTIYTFDLNQLSDGYRTMLALTLDLARRMAEANPPAPNSPDPLQSEAIVLIDEVDLHLHPSWQQRIVSDLEAAFPNSQFILTSHSPQVLTTVPSHCIRIIENGQVYSAPPGTEGAESARLLTRVLGVDVRPPENKVTKELMEYLELVHTDQWDKPKALELRRKLDSIYQGEEPALLEADLHIENRKWELSGEAHH